MKPEPFNGKMHWLVPYKQACSVIQLQEIVLIKFLI